jgi:hypothetical protein
VEVGGDLARRSLLRGRRREAEAGSYLGERIARRRQRRGLVAPPPGAAPAPLQPSSFVQQMTEAPVAPGMPGAPVPPKEG